MDLSLILAMALMNKIKNLANNLKARYIIFSNGAFIYDNFKDEILNIEYIDHNEAKKVLRPS
ncbi:Uncharacterised protein (plasmid) [Mycoplasmopsis cynos]|uniref:Uncharacterized protein n=2 Tax=Mycoplasmopsis cynos TaxID=171284 RepID=A0A449AJD1_9BACT|nr:Uncharacterised protein [Mycoplasmopsis cynos]